MESKQEEREIAWEAIVIVLLLLFIGFLTFMKFKDKEESDNIINALNKEIKMYKLKSGQAVASKNTVFLDKNSSKDFFKTKGETAKELSKQFSKVKTFTEAETETKIPKIEIVYKDSVPFIYERKDSVRQKEYSFDYLSTHKKLEISNFKIVDTLSVMTGMKRKWFLGKTTSTVDITHSNQYITTKEVQHIEFVEKKKWYQTTMFKIGVGILLYETGRQQLINK